MTVQRAKVAVAVVFLLNGLAFASWVSRVPALKDALSLTPGGVGLLLLCLSGGTLVALPLSGAVIGRLGPARTVLTGATLTGLGLLVMGLGVGVAAVPVVGLGMFAYGIGTSGWDVAMNVEAADVEHRLDRTIMPRFHAGFSLGTVLGALVGAACARLDVALSSQLVGTVVVIALVVPVSLRRFLPVEDADQRDTRPRPSLLSAWREPRTLAIGLLVMAFALCEGIANDWLALSLVDGYGAVESVGAIGFGVFVAAMTLGRLFGGSPVERFGRVAVLRATAGLVVAGVLVVVLSPGLPGAMAGAVLWGLGASLGFPLGMSAAADEEDRAAVRLSVVSSIGYAAFLGGPPLVGLLADHVGVRHAILVACGAAVVGLLVAPAARSRRTSRADRLPA
ncbi:MFS transporter [Nocardioides mesophilus]|uniref:MFS transporter n=1 Tax=Nocardioides mesophilus TaxID=433659 RepID=UPI001FEB98F6|nr:MFS transporter [Nocardioides mesophilus]